jgi:hypothetical protein
MILKHKITLINSQMSPYHDQSQANVNELHVRISSVCKLFFCFWSSAFPRLLLGQVMNFVDKLGYYQPCEFINHLIGVSELLEDSESNWCLMQKHISLYKRGSMFCSRFAQVSTCPFLKKCCLSLI